MEHHFQQQNRLIPFKNESGEVIPPFACMQLDYNYESGDSALALDASDSIVDVKKPDSDGARYPGLLIFNSSASVGVGKSGLACIDPVCLALWDDEDGSPEVGWSVGAKSGSWYLSMLGKGYRIKSYDSTQAYFLSASQRTVLIEPDDNVHEIVKITSTTKDSNGFYPGIVQRYDPIGLAWQTIHTCKVLDANA